MTIPKDPNTPEGGAGKGDGGTQDPTSTPQTQNEPSVDRTFTQAEVDVIAGRARSEERAKYPDYNKVKARNEELETAALSETEKLKKDLADAQKVGADADERVSTMAIKSDIRVRAAQAGVVDVDAVEALLDRSGVSYDDEAGEVTGVDSAIASLIEEKPYLKGTGTPKAANLNPGGNPAPADITLTSDQMEMARRNFPGKSDSEAFAEYKLGIAPTS